MACYKPLLELVRSIPNGKKRKMLAVNIKDSALIILLEERLFTNLLNNS